MTGKVPRHSNGGNGSGNRRVRTTHGSATSAQQAREGIHAPQPPSRAAASASGDSNARVGAVAEGEGEVLTAGDAVVGDDDYSGDEYSIHSLDVDADVDGVSQEVAENSCPKSETNTTGGGACSGGSDASYSTYINNNSGEYVVGSCNERVVAGESSDAGSYTRDSDSSSSNNCKPVRKSARIAGVANGIPRRRAEAAPYAPPLRAFVGSTGGDDDCSGDEYSIHSLDVDADVNSVSQEVAENSCHESETNTNAGGTCSGSSGASNSPYINSHCGERIGATCDERVLAGDSSNAGSDARDSDSSNNFEPARKSARIAGVASGAPRRRAAAIASRSRAATGSAAGAAGTGKGRGMFWSPQRLMPAMKPRNLEAPAARRKSHLNRSNLLITFVN
ncbi:hypothetical protein JKP88DRAFT_241829 [Tribonema minus]|uniref:Uncharacterized protein n=1 Tax=Tribonema minus TaxID=303371 RepID=A0A835YQW4_9STRA|nr:hypothetical protein JKP88DRAFT_241829 [Tribonema minus]